MSAFEYASSKLKAFLSETPEKKPKITVHLNFMEGHCLAPVSEVSDLVDENGFFKISWGSLFKCNYNPLVRNKIKKQLKAEILAQTNKCLTAGIISKDDLRFDGHQHTHMIPLVFESLLAACTELENDGCKVTFIRNTQDSISPYFKAAKKDKELKKSFDKVNIVKCLILNHYSHKIQKSLKKRSLPVPYLCGVFFSGNMDFQRLEKVLPFFCEKPLIQKRNVELLFHPGSVLESEITQEFVKKGFVDFHLSKGRKIEYESVIKLHNKEGE